VLRYLFHIKKDNPKNTKVFSLSVDFQKLRISWLTNTGLEKIRYFILSVSIFIQKRTTQNKTSRIHYLIESSSPNIGIIMKFPSALGGMIPFR